MLHNVYGATETNDSVVWSLEPHEPVPALVPIGRSLDGVRARVVDAEGHELVGSLTYGTVATLAKLSTNIKPCCRAEVLIRSMTSSIRTVPIARLRMR